jgi:N-acetylated-alpha-linked acidic dipeptidase
MRSALLIALVLATTTLAGAATEPSTAESRLVDSVTTQGALGSSKVINQTAHYPGTLGDQRMANWMRDQLRAAGFDATVESFMAPVYTPKKLSLSLLTTPPVVFNLYAQPVAADPDGTRPDAGIPFNSGSGNGDVTAPVVYAGRGEQADYDALAAANVDVSRKIVLVRYGAEFRGILAKRAQDNGALGVLFYIDPADEGTDPPYPQGASSPLGSTQRGSLGTGITIPTLPITALAATQILQQVQGASAPETFWGELPVEYRLGQSSVNVHLVVQMQRKMTRLWNTIGTLRGLDPIQMVVLGGHRDAWVYGVTDNGSGISSLLEAARALGKLRRSGWIPRRSIVIVGFDGEEIGEVGSNQYTSAHKAALEAGAIAYLNADEVTTGQTFGADGVAGLSSSLISNVGLVPDPRNPQQTLLARWKKQTGGAAVATIGGGSDFEPFLYDLGIPVAEVGFSGSSFGVYHSGFDSLRYATKIADPGFLNHRAVAQLLALMAYRYAYDQAYPYSFTAYSNALHADFTALAKTAHDLDALEPVSQAADRFAAAAARFDASAVAAQGNARARALAQAIRNTKALVAAKMLDQILYGRNGYAPVALPQLTAAESGNGSIPDAVKATVSALDTATAVLH